MFLLVVMNNILYTFCILNVMEELEELGSNDVVDSIY